MIAALLFAVSQSARAALCWPSPPGWLSFFQASRIALVRFDPYLGSHALAIALQQSPPGQLIEADAYYAFSSVFFYTDQTALLLNGRMNNLEYGSYAPKAPQIFIDDARFAQLWSKPDRYYLLTYGADMSHMEQLVGRANLIVVKENGGNFLLTNRPCADETRVAQPPSAVHNCDWSEIRDADAAACESHPNALQSPHA